MRWRWSLPTRDLVLGERCLVMGIVNVTPDSFSDGGLYADADAAVAHALRLVDDGADILDIGGESTRPGSTGVDVDEEIGRVIPVIERLASRTDVPISIDTQKAAVAERAVTAGAEIVNDVSGLRADPEMARTVARTNAALVLMHMKGSPETMQRAPSYTDLFAEMREYFAEGVAHARAHGIPPGKIVLDPGIGFGKRLEHNLALLANPEAFASLVSADVATPRRAAGDDGARTIGDHPLLFGVSRKSMFATLLGREVDERDDATTACTAVLAFLGAAIVRVHDVRRAVDAARVGDALRAARRSDMMRPTGAGQSSTVDEGRVDA